MMEMAFCGQLWTQARQFSHSVASLMLEKYLKGEISPERQYLEDRLMTTRFF